MSFGCSRRGWIGGRHGCFLEVVIRKHEVRVTVSFGFMQLVKDLTILGQNGPKRSLPLFTFSIPKTKYWNKDHKDWCNYLDLNLNWDFLSLSSVCFPPIMTILPSLICPHNDPLVPRDEQDQYEIRPVLTAYGYMVNCMSSNIWDYRGGTKISD